MASSETLKANKREKVGTRTAKKLRAEGRIPANLQGDGKDHIDFSIDAREFHASRRHHVHLYDLDIDGNVESAVVREMQWDTFGDYLMHVEFKRVTRGVKTEADVALEFTGHPKGGVLNQLLSHIKINCLPSQIPDSIEVPVGALGEGDSIHGRDIQLPEGMDLVTDADAIIASIAAMASDEPEGGDEEADDGMPAPE